MDTSRINYYQKILKVIRQKIDEGFVDEALEIWYDLREEAERNFEIDEIAMANKLRLIQERLGSWF